MSVIVGLWDGHDSGACVIRDGEILSAINEERLTRRKLEVDFPSLSIRKTLQLAGVRAEEVDFVAVSTFDIAKTLTRLLPSLKENYYLIRRRKKHPGRFWESKRRFKYWLTSRRGLTSLQKKLGAKVIRHELGKLGLGNAEIRWIEHHHAHACASAITSGFESCAVLTLDGVGDGLSGTISDWDGHTLRRVEEIPASDSLGIFFEHLTYRLNMRELEDEGKAMALACLARPVDDNQNELLELFEVDGLRLRARGSRGQLFKKLDKVFWHYPSEQVAFMVQRLLELRVSELARNIVTRLGRDSIALSGGLFANIKVNRSIRILPEVRRCYVFPNMGDGGLALGSAIALHHALFPGQQLSMPSIYLGVSYTADEIRQAIERAGLNARRSTDLVSETVELIMTGEPIAWFQGRMEYGPRALGARSILAFPYDPAVRDLLNLSLKRRVWYQPYCPSLLEDEAGEYFEDYDGEPDRFMTMAYTVKPHLKKKTRAVIAGDGTCRPQMVLRLAPEENLFADLLKEFRKRAGSSLLLNTSFNLHGEPLVCSPEDALRSFLLAGLRAMVIGEFILERA